ncbi:MAG: NnrU family protein, partial [Bradyrhizobium sp.]
MPERGYPEGRGIMGLAVMILGLALFLGVHTLPAQRELRGRTIAAMGEGGYKLAYALVSVLGIALIAWGFAHYRAAGMIDVWEGLVPAKALVILKHITIALMLPAVILVVAAFMR